MFIPINKVVISYSRKDSLKVRELVEALRSRNIDPFLDIDDIPAGVDWEKCLEQAIGQAYALVFALSNSSLNSQVCLWELQTAINADIPILPIVFEQEDVSIPESLPQLKKANWVFLNNPKTYDLELTKLIDGLLQIDLYRGELDRSPKAKLTVFCKLPSGEMVIDYFVLAAKCYTFGRNPESSPQVSILKVSGDPTVSNRHAVLVWQGDSKTYGIRDGSLNGDRCSTFGVYVGCTPEKGKAAGGMRLEDGEIHLLKNLEFVRFGKFSFFCYETVQGSTINFDGKDTLSSAEEEEESQSKN